VSQAGVLRGGDKPGRSVLRPYMTEVTDALATRPNGGRSEPRPTIWHTTWRRDFIYGHDVYRHMRLARSRGV